MGLYAGVDYDLTMYLWGLSNNYKLLVNAI
jgi:hypothetical protein